MTGTGTGRRVVRSDTWHASLLPRPAGAVGTTYCSSSDYHYFGDQPSGDYHITVTKIQGSTSGYYLSVNSVYTRY
ncbi:hypothetical protein [Streptomyces sp. TRM68367]|uniref:hypothetical protein n=1 Tax=Streptomyces sp. TRM68367 TaxID=2758415 RepID=UPI00165CB38F|nr:hypothetical protein [Streptomyces sp. TRM68367]MBC9729971.1 hypothetical protein [Streptomyces sp. TRM68367]